MTVDAGQLVGGIVLLVGGMGSIVWWFIRHINARVDAERDARHAVIEAERKAREEDRHMLRNEINSVGGRVTEHELKVAREYATSGDLTHALEQALKPVEGALGRLERAVERVFGILENKADKHGGVQ